MFLTGVFVKAFMCLCLHEAHCITLCMKCPIKKIKLPCIIVRVLLIVEKTNRFMLLLLTRIPGLDRGEFNPGYCWKLSLKRQSNRLHYIQIPFWLWWHRLVITRHHKKARSFRSIFTGFDLIFVFNLWVKSVFPQKNCYCNFPALVWPNDRRYITAAGMNSVVRGEPLYRLPVIRLLRIPPSRSTSSTPR